MPICGDPSFILKMNFRRISVQIFLSSDEDVVKEDEESVYRDICWYQENSFLNIILNITVLIKELQNNVSLFISIYLRAYAKFSRRISDRMHVHCSLRMIWLENFFFTLMRNWIPFKSITHVNFIGWSDLNNNNSIANDGGGRM